MRMENAARKGSNAPADLRARLAFLADRGKLAIAREGIGLADELAAVAKRLERDSAVLFPRPDGHEILSSPTCLPAATGSPTPSA